jgi:Leucine-rich repeat (LRR) protein
VSIDLSFNDISILDENAFDKVPRLETIVISDNGIKVVQPEVFGRQQGLKHVDIHNNNINRIHPQTFQHNSNLSTLDLSCNNLKFLRYDFNSNNELKFLNLSSNMLTFEDLTFFLPISSLEILDLSNNDMENVTEEIFDGMVNLKHLNISGNPRLEYDCRLRTLWTLCLKQNMTCVTGDEQSFRMVDNLNCGTEEESAVFSVANESDGFINTSEYSTEGDVNEGSGTEPVGRKSDNEAKEFNSTEKDFNQPTVTSNHDVTLIIGIIVGSGCGVMLIVGGVFLIRRHRCTGGETSGNLSRTNSIRYLNTENGFTGSNRSPRSGRNVGQNSYELVNLTRANTSVSHVQYAGTVAAEIARVPSFRTRVAAPLNLPEEISV